jgi:hypothetical protein
MLVVSAELSGIGICLFGGQVQGLGRNSVAVPSAGNVRFNARQFISPERVFVFAHDFADAGWVNLAFCAE